MFDFERIIEGLFATDVSSFFTIVILSYLSFALLLLFRKDTSGRLSALAEISPGVLTSLVS